MALVIVVSAGGIGFLLVYLRALSREPKGQQPQYVLLIQLAEPADVVREEEMCPSCGRAVQAAVGR